MFTEKDIEQMNGLGINPKTAEKQLEYFKNGFPFIQLVRPAIPGDGIMVLDSKEISRLVDLYEKESVNEKVVKFVPASGAATRMFKDLYSFVEEWDEEESDENRKKFASVYTVLHQINHFAFFEDLKLLMKKEYNIDLNSEVKKENYKQIIQAILSEKGLNYGNLPKALLKFHKYADENRTSLEEHLVEGALYSADSDKKVNIHFTVTPEHLPLFKKLLAELQYSYETRFEVSFNISYSIQKPSTDTIAVNLDNTPFRGNDQKLLFRPGGHGALLENLNEINASIIFIKNIDNVVPDSLKNETVKFKKTIGGMLLDLRKSVFTFLEKIEKKEEAEKLKKDIIEFYKNHFHISFSDEISLEKLAQFLNRPIRICGMVKNEGEPGGGPYWIYANNNMSLQIIESSQINYSSEEQVDIFKKASHFNPVDLVCSVTDFKGNKFDLAKFVDPETGFISKKSKDGRDLKALELPGLWNGAMSDWNTMFVDVPLITFNPVKTINDLLRKEHQER